MKIADLDLKRLLPIFMRRDEFNNALSDALSAPLRVFARECGKLSTFDALGSLTAPELDSLADELNVFWYDKTLPDEKKRALLAQSDKVYMRIGTKEAVQMVVGAVFGDAKVAEFWEYEDGKPHYFRIFVEDFNPVTNENVVKLERLIAYVQRRSQWLDGIVGEVVSQMPMRFGIMQGVHKAYGSVFIAKPTMFSIANLRVACMQAVHKSYVTILDATQYQH